MMGPGNGDQIVWLFGQDSNNFKLNFAWGFFSGTGNVEYVSTDTVEFPVLRFNATKSTKLKLEKGAGGLRIQDRFETLLFLTPGRSLVDLTGHCRAPGEGVAKHVRSPADENRPLLTSSPSGS
jgi:hypothetical protein